MSEDPKDIATLVELARALTSLQGTPKAFKVLEHAINQQISIQKDKVLKESEEKKLMITLRHRRAVIGMIIGGAIVLSAYVLSWILISKGKTTESAAVASTVTASAALFILGGQGLLKPEHVFRDRKPKNEGGPAKDIKSPESGLPNSEEGPTKSLESSEASSGE